MIQSSTDKREGVRKPVNWDGENMGDDVLDKRGMLYCLMSQITDTHSLVIKATIVSNSIETLVPTSPRTLLGRNSRLGGGRRAWYTHDKQYVRSHSVPHTQ